MSFTGGALKLKGGTGLSGIDKKKKKKKSKQEAAGEAEEATEQQLALSNAQGSGEFAGQYQPAEDLRTEAERKHDEVQAKRAAEKSRKMAMKSHRERVAEYNTHLSNLSEHHDIPRVGPG